MAFPRSNSNRAVRVCATGAESVAAEGGLPGDRHRQGGGQQGLVARQDHGAGEWKIVKQKK